MSRRGRIALAATVLMAIMAIGASAADTGGISAELIQRWTSGKLSGPAKALADVVANKEITEVALNRDRYITHSKIFDFKIKTGDVTNQKGSGRCWMFAGFNVLRAPIIKKLKLKNFEFSENYLMFWDKMEKVNFFLQGMIDMAERPIDDRELSVLLEDPLGDGGWWSYFVDLVKKYGVVPKEAMPETYNSSSTGTMNTLISLKVKEMGLELRNMARAKAKPAVVLSRKEALLGEAYRLLVLNLGHPPTRFVWRYETTDTVGAITQSRRLTPQEFYTEVIDWDLDQYVTLFDYAGKDYYQNYAIRLSRNMYDRPNFTVLNLPIDSLRIYALKSILDSTPVWFACDVGRDNYGAEGILAAGIYNYEALYGTEFMLSKADLIQTGLITPNHAMTFIGVDTVGGKAEKWLVENSWGGERGDKGSWTMYNDWFDKYLFGLVIQKKYLPEAIIKLSQQLPLELPPWDPVYPVNRLN